MPCAAFFLLALVAMPAAAQRANRIDPRGAAVHAGGAEIIIGVTRLGRAADLHEARAGRVGSSDGLVTIERDDGVQEWWRTLDVGMEQGVTFERRPSGDGPLVVEVGVGGALPVLDGQGGATLVLAGEPVLSYGALAVFDARGATVPAILRVEEGRLQIEVDDRDATYPIVVDPLVISLEDTFPMADSGLFGVSLGLASDGSRLVIGAPAEGSGGAFHTYNRVGVMWTEEPVITATGTGTFGNAMGLSADASRVVLADQGYNGPLGRIVCYTRAGATWSLAWQRVGAFMSGTGISAAISADGSVVAGVSNAGVELYDTVGTPTFLASASGVTAAALSSNGSRLVLNTGTVYVRSGATYVVETSALTGGTAVSMSDDGARIAFVGTTSGRVFVRTGTTWAVEGTLSSGASVAMSRDGTRVLVGRRPAGSIEVFVRTGSTWSSGGTLASAESGFGAAVALTQTGTRAAVGAPTVNTMTTAASGVAHVYTILNPRGTACVTAADCGSGWCADAVCCDEACGASASNDCKACSIAAGGTANGTCTALSSARAAATTCRASAGVCDPAETCVAANNACPPDARASTVCRVAVTNCDVTETCNGASVDCPTDAFVAVGTECRVGAGPCDTPETCSGLAPTCPPDTFRSSGSVCSPRDPASECDADDVCDGASATCPVRFADATQTCGPAPSGPCDAPDHCTGTSGDCMATFLVGVDCRASGGACDPTEVCLGDTPDCPSDQVAPAGTVCRASSDTSCDPAESCDGVAASCPAEVSTCVDSGVQDAGIVDVGSRDASAAGDAGVPPTAATGCACAVGRSPSTRRGLCLGLAVLALIAAGPVRRKLCVRLAT